MTALLLSRDLAPSLVTRVTFLLAEVALGRASRGVVCHQGGGLGGDHAADGRVQLVHRSCHRRLRRSGHSDVGPLPASRRPRTAC